jgi:hypothetical protein
VVQEPGVVPTVHERRGGEQGREQRRARMGGFAALLDDFVASEEYRRLTAVRMPFPPGHYYSPVVDPASLAKLAADLKTVWADPSTDARLKKRIVRTVIHEVIADIDPEAAEIVLVVHWTGGVHSEMRLPRRRRGQRNSTSADVIVAVRQLVLIANDDLIAGILNRNGLVTGYGNRWTRERVTSLRSHHRIDVYKHADDGIEPWLNLSKAARLLHVAPRTLRLAAEAGEIEAIHPLPDGPWIFSRTALSTSSARAITERARQNPKYPTGSHPDQQSLFSSIA